MGGGREGGNGEWGGLRERKRTKKMRKENKEKEKEKYKKGVNLMTYTTLVPTYLGT